MAVGAAGPGPARPIPYGARLGCAVPGAALPCPALTAALSGRKLQCELRAAAAAAASPAPLSAAAGGAPPAARKFRIGSPDGGPGSGGRRRRLLPAPDPGPEPRRPRVAGCGAPVRA